MKGAKGSLKLLSSSTAMLGSLHVVHPTPTECAGGGVPHRKHGTPPSRCTLRSSLLSDLGKGKN